MSDLSRVYPASRPVTVEVIRVTKKSEKGYSKVENGNRLRKFWDKQEEQ